MMTQNDKILLNKKCLVLYQIIYNHITNTLPHIQHKLVFGLPEVDESLWLLGVPDVLGHFDLHASLSPYIIHDLSTS